MTRPSLDRKYQMLGNCLFRHSVEEFIHDGLPVESFQEIRSQIKSGLEQRLQDWSKYISPIYGVSAIPIERRLLESPGQYEPTEKDFQTCMSCRCFIDKDFICPAKTIWDLAWQMNISNYTIANRAPIETKPPFSLDYIDGDWMFVDTWRYDSIPPFFAEELSHLPLVNLFIGVSWGDYTGKYVILLEDAFGKHNIVKSHVINSIPGAMETYSEAILSGLSLLKKPVRLALHCNNKNFVCLEQGRIPPSIANNKHGYKYQGDTSLIPRFGSGHELGGIKLMHNGAYGNGEEVTLEKLHNFAERLQYPSEVRDANFNHLAPVLLSPKRVNNVFPMRKR